MPRFPEMFEPLADLMAQLLVAQNVRNFWIKTALGVLTLIPSLVGELEHF